MIYKYMYSIVLSADVENITKKDNFSFKNISKNISKINSDVLNEYFYYAIEDPNIESTYDTDFTICTKTNSYEINHKIFSNQSDMIDKISELYGKIPDFNEIVELSGCDLEEVYEILQIEKMKIKNLKVNIELFEFIDEFDNSFDTLNSSTKLKIIETKLI